MSLPMTKLMLSPPGSPLDSSEELKLQNRFKTSKEFGILLEDFIALIAKKRVISTETRDFRTWVNLCKRKERIAQQKRETTPFIHITSRQRVPIPRSYSLNQLKLKYYVR